MTVLWTLLEPLGSRATYAGAKSDPIPAATTREIRLLTARDGEAAPARKGQRGSSRR